VRVSQPLETYQDEIYLNGLSGAVPALPADLSRLDDLARDRLTAQSYGYIGGGAGSGDTMTENAAAFRRWRIVPRMLTDVSSPSYQSEVLGTSLIAPMLLAPIGVLKIAHPDGELAVARAAAALGVPMILSTAASATMEEVAEANGGGQRWFQLYWPKDRDVAASLLGRARAAGFSVLMVTLDTRLLGWRPHDLDAAYLPFLQGVGVQNYFSDPVFQAGLAASVADDPGGAVLHWVQMFGDPSLTWDDLPFLREHWEGPVVLNLGRPALSAGALGRAGGSQGHPVGGRRPEGCGCGRRRDRGVQSRRASGRRCAWVT
jgi:L-lactate dehydrogenase (cytochrome)